MSKTLFKTVLIILGTAFAGLLISLLLSSDAHNPDMSGREARSQPDEPPPERIICMSPSVTELTYALGQGDRVVGVSQHTVYPPEAAEKPKCGGFVNPNLERIMDLQPDLIVTQGLAKKVTDFAQKHDIPSITLDLTDLESIYSAIHRLGKVYKCREKADKLNSRIRDQLDAVRERVKDRPVRRTFVVIGRAPGNLRNLTTIGSGSYLDDVLRIAGGKNIFDDLSRDYATINKETLTERRPQVILELHGEGMMEPAKRKRIHKTWSNLPVLPAVKKDRIYIINSDYALIPGPRVTELAQDIANKLHPPRE